MVNYREKLKDAKRIVIKVGTSTITYDTGKSNMDVIEKLALVISDLKNQGKEIILVTSGAIAVGNSNLGLEKKSQSMSEKQAAASIGQCKLMQIYSRFFAEFGYVVGQILITKEEVNYEERRNNIQNTFNTLLSFGSVPIVNENDTISFDEIEFGDNDTLSAIVAEITNSDLLILLSDIEGLYNNDPRKDSKAKLISMVENIDDEIEKYASKSGTDRGTGGMVTKISAAKFATSEGIDVVIASGADPLVIRKIIEGENIGTLFTAKGV